MVGNGIWTPLNVSDTSPYVNSQIRDRMFGQPSGIQIKDYK
jgi:hypothetical protein